MRAQRKLRDSRDKQTQLFYRNRDMLCKASCQLRAALFFYFFFSFNNVRIVLYLYL